ncbi:uncharacterized protein BDV17DRAFT_294056 [Aspergillus undulatus]|uniref:uncharacterized protein n=1 Tax=Aspergillus undulatus TaxID=1810928 RepID=UPI003CCDD366
MGAIAKAASVAADVVDYVAVVRQWPEEERVEKEKKFLQKIDMRLLPILMVMHVMNYIDCNALPQARVQALEDDLNLSGYEYDIVLSLTFIGYILMQGMIFVTNISV